MFNITSNKFPLSVSLFTLLLYGTQSIAQLPTVACICELEALMLESKITNTEMVIQETESGYSYYFENKEEPKEDKEIEAPEIDVEEEIEETAVKSDLVSRVPKDYSNRKKRKKRKKRVKRKKFKKYKGNCYRFN